VVSPILSNVYLHKLDEYAEASLIPRWTRGRYRKRNPEYLKLTRKEKRALQSGNQAEAREIGKQRRTLPSGNPADPGYRRLLYVRYADLCRRRHKSAYAEPRIMPTGLLDGPPGGRGVVLSAA
jgi:hypothetical protein